MGKNKNKTELAAAPMGKKELKALQAREAELAAALKASTKKAKKKGHDGNNETEAISAAHDEAVAKAKGAIDRGTLARLKKIVADDTAKTKHRLAALAELTDLRGPLAKGQKAYGDENSYDYAARKALEKGTPKPAKSEPEAPATPDDATSAPEPVVSADPVVSEAKARLKKKREARATETPEGEVAPYVEPDHMGDLIAKRNAEKAAAKLAKLAAPEQTVEAVETETGTVYAAGSETPDSEPVEAVTAFEAGAGTPEVAVEHDGLGRYKIKNPTTGKFVGYTRATTFIDCLDDKSFLDKWKQRNVVAGLALNSTSPDVKPDVHLVSQAADLIHNRSVALAKLDKDDRKGRLPKGLRAPTEEKIEKAFKDGMDRIASDALEVGGANVKREKGTELHALTELYDLEGFEAINVKLKAGEITPADHADVMAYAEECIRWGLTVLEVEQVVVDDVRKIAGRFDRLYSVKLPGTQRASRVIGDVKTGRLDMGAGKISQQLDIYANAKGYDPNEPDARRDIKANKNVALVVHLVPGSGVCTIHPVDLKLGNARNKLAVQVRESRNTGKKAIGPAWDETTFTPLEVPLG